MRACVHTVQPSAPENVTLTVEEERGEGPRLLVKWEPPRDTDPRSGWVTIIYELRVKREDDKEWEVRETVEDCGKGLWLLLKLSIIDQWISKVGSGGSRPGGP